MSHFSFYPYLLNPTHSQSQILRNLHSLFYLTNPPHYSNFSSPLFSPTTNLTFFSDQFKKSTQTSHSSEFQIKNQEILRIPCNSTNINILSQTHQLKKQQTKERQHESSHFEKVSSEVVSKNQNKKTKTKSKTKKVSKKEKKERQMKRNSTENSKRNIIPNEIHQILSIILKKNRSADMVEKLLSKQSAKICSTQLSVQRFYLYQSLLKEKINHYANEESLRYLLRNLEPQYVIYSREQQEIYCKVGLTLISYFLREMAALIILNSQRIKSSNKLDHLKAKRYLQNFINQMVQETFHSKKPLSQTFKEQKQCI